MCCKVVPNFPAMRGFFVLDQVENAVSNVHALSLGFNAFVEEHRAQFVVSSVDVNAANVIPKCIGRLE